jgi:hypothetical protein
MFGFFTQKPPDLGLRGAQPGGGTRPHPHPVAAFCTLCPLIEILSTLLYVSTVFFGICIDVYPYIEVAHVFTTRCRSYGPKRVAEWPRNLDISFVCSPMIYKCRVISSCLI